MNNFLEESLFAGVTLSLIAYLAGSLLRKKFKLGIFNPLLISIVITVVVLIVGHIDYDTYYVSAKYLSYLLTPATVCLAVPLYEKFDLLKKNLKAVSIGITSGVITSLCSILVMAVFFKLNHEEYVTFLPKSITTAIGIGSTGASVINEVSKGRISYKLWMGIACVVGAVFGSFGIQNIINYVTPIFLIMYPICIVLTVLGLVDKWIPNDGVYKFGVAVAGIVSVGDAILAVAPNLDGLRKVMYMIPLAEQGFSWLIPTVIAMVIGGIVYRGKPRYNYGETAVATEEAGK